MLRIQKGMKEVKSVKDYVAAASEVREENARTVERLAKKRSRTATHNLILQLVTAIALMASIYLASQMRYTPAETIVFVGCIVWQGLFLFANRR